MAKINKIIDCIQGTDEWFEARRGKVTASCFSNATAGGTGKTRMNYMYKLLAERLTGEVDRNGYTNKYMEWGNEQEERARICYELETGLEVEQIGFVLLNENIGCSPDGLIGNDGLVQIKCPASQTHINYLITGKAPSEYMKQIEGELWVTEREWSDFVSYDPRNLYKDLFKIRVYRDDKFISMLEKDIYIFVEELLKYEQKLKNQNI